MGGNIATTNKITQSCMNKVARYTRRYHLRRDTQASQLYCIGFLRRLEHKPHVTCTLGHTWSWFRKGSGRVWWVGVFTQCIQQTYRHIEPTRYTKCPPSKKSKPLSRISIKSY